MTFQNEKISSNCRRFTTSNYVWVLTSCCLLSSKYLKIRLQANVVKPHFVIELFVRAKVVKTNVVINPCCQEFLLSENKLSEPMLSESMLSEPMLSILGCQSRCCQKKSCKDPMLSEPMLSEPTLSEPMLSESMLSEAKLSDLSKNCPIFIVTILKMFKKS